MDKNKLEQFIQRAGRNASRILTILGKNQQFVNALNTPIGAELLKDIVVRMEDILTKIVNEEATEMERAEFRVLKSLSSKWTERVNDYYKLLTEVNKVDN